MAAAVAAATTIALQELPQDVLARLSALLSPKDLCNLSLACKQLHALCRSDKLWWIKCRDALWNHPVDLQAWRAAMPSYKAIFRFVQAVIPLLGIWVHKKPEQGNMVYVTWGFLSVVGCRIIPQELGPRRLESGLLWTPVFEIICDCDGGLAFFLHGREKDKDFCYPGCINSARANCNVLVLEAEPRKRSGSLSSRAVSVQADDREESCVADKCRRLSKPRAKTSKLKKHMEPDHVPFHRLHFSDRRKVLEAAAHHVRLEISKVAIEPFFFSTKGGPMADIDPKLAKDEWNARLLRMLERRSLLLWMHSHGPDKQHPSFRPYYDGIDSLYLLQIMCTLPENEDIPVAAKQLEGEPRKGKALFVSETSGKKMKQMQITGMGQGKGSGNMADGSDSSAMNQLLLQQFLRQSDTVALHLHATFWNLSTYQAWPLIHGNLFALYKMPEQQPKVGREHAGLWGGSFGWPPGKPAEDKFVFVKASYCLLLSYEDTEEGRLLIATKILEGSNYVVYPNGSAMFTVNVDEPSSEPFPWHADRDGTPIDIVHSYQGEGITTGYGFRYPGHTPGDLFVERNGMLAFVWRETRLVLTLHRLDLHSLLEKGKRVAALPPVANFIYLSRSYNNAFAGSSGSL